MFRRGHLFLLISICGVCFLMALKLRIFQDGKNPASTEVIIVHKLREAVIKTVLNRSIPALANMLQHMGPMNVGEMVETNKSMKLTETSPSATDSPAREQPLPLLTAKPQDSFYGPGCNVNRYRGRLQKVLYEWQRIVKRRKISDYFICFGSFLGSVRNGDMVPYDSDMDVCMFRKEYHKLYPEESQRPVNLNDGKIHMLLQRHSPHPRADTPRKDCNGNIVRSVSDSCAILDPHARLYLGALIYLDIFMIEDHGAQLWDEYRDKMHARDIILPVKPCKYLGLDTNCPNNTEKYLNVYYGKDYMKPHHVCRAGKWVQNMAGARAPFV